MLHARSHFLSQLAFLCLLHSKLNELDIISVIHIQFPLSAFLSRSCCFFLHLLKKEPVITSATKGIESNEKKKCEFKEFRA